MGTRVASTYANLFMDPHGSIPIENALEFGSGS